MDEVELDVRAAAKEGAAVAERGGVAQRGLHKRDHAGALHRARPARVRLVPRELVVFEGHLAGDDIPAELDAVEREGAAALPLDPFDAVVQKGVGLHEEVAPHGVDGAAGGVGLILDEVRRAHPRRGGADEAGGGTQRAHGAAFLGALSYKRARADHNLGGALHPDRAARAGAVSAKPAGAEEQAGPDAGVQRAAVGGRVVVEVAGVEVDLAEAVQDPDGAAPLVLPPLCVLSPVVQKLAVVELGLGLPDVDGAGALAGGVPNECHVGELGVGATLPAARGQRAQADRTPHRLGAVLPELTEVDAHRRVVPEEGPTAVLRPVARKQAILQLDGQRGHAAADVHAPAAALRARSVRGEVAQEEAPLELRLGVLHGDAAAIHLGDAGLKGAVGGQKVHGAHHFEGAAAGGAVVGEVAPEEVRASRHQHRAAVPGKIL
mmetsp:Transcript_48109/g.121437  ORF Transcript_48109/g.121437 Transcript_48109/m.121437 type:complete len:435 (+) Transcript_48109:1096-2400(+)